MMQSKCRRMAAVFILSTAVYGKAVKAQPMPQAANTHLVLPAKTYTIPFYWQGDSVNSKWEPHAALLIPVKLKNCPRLFYMQFDSGHPYSIFYKNKLLAIRLKYPGAMPLCDSGRLTGFSFKAGKMPVLAKEIVVQQFDSSTINWKDKNSVEIIGTIGADFIDGKTVIIDYPRQELTISVSVPVKLMSCLSLTGFVYAGRNILLPAKVQGKQTMLYFDTGSSMYELLTDKKTCERLSIPGSDAIQSKARSWDKYLTATSLASNDSIAIDGFNIPIHYATYIEGMSSAQVEQMMKMGIGGMTGNKIFLPYKLVLDTKNKKFGLISSE